MSDSEYESISESEEETIFEMEEEEVVDESITNDNDLEAEWDNFKKDYKNMSKEELLDHIKCEKLKKRKYIQKYQRTEKGRVKTREASKKYYDANRAKILEKKRLAYIAKKEKQEPSV